MNVCDVCAVIDAVRVRGDSCGGEVTCVVRGAPVGLGSPVFDKLEAELAKAAMSLPASKVHSPANSQPFWKVKCEMQFMQKLDLFLQSLHSFPPAHHTSDKSGRMGGVC